jgi:hypothetical protein
VRYKPHIFRQETSSPYLNAQARHTLARNALPRERFRSLAHSLSLSERSNSSAYRGPAAIGERPIRTRRAILQLPGPKPVQAFDRRPLVHYCVLAAAGVPTTGSPRRRWPKDDAASSFSRTFPDLVDEDPTSECFNPRRPRDPGERRTPRARRPAGGTAEPLYDFIAARCWARWSLRAQVQAVAWPQQSGKATIRATTHSLAPWFSRRLLAYERLGKGRGDAHSTLWGRPGLWRAFTFGRHSYDPRRFIEKQQPG